VPLEDRAESVGAYILGTLSEDDVDWLIDHGRRSTIPAGEFILRDGQPIQTLMLVLAGELDVRYTDGYRQRLEPGTVVGGIGLLGGEAALDCVIAAVETALFEIDYPELLGKLEFDFAFAARFYRAIAVIMSEREAARSGRQIFPAGVTSSSLEVNTLLARDRLRRMLHRAQRTPTVIVTGGDLTIEEVARVARGRAPVALGEDARRTLREAREVVEELAARDDPVYGLTTNLGELKDQRLDPSRQPLFQRHVLLSHATGLPPDFPTDVVRAILLARLNGMARGGSGVQPAVFDALLAMLNARVHPIVPSRGSIGMSDLAPLAHLSLPLVGEGEVEFEGERMSGAAGLEAGGIEAPTLGPKDALSLVSANSASIGHGALVMCDARALLGVAEIAAALSLEALGGHTTMLDQQVDSARRFTGQLACAERTRAILDESYLWTCVPTLDVQDPISFRSAIQVHGAMLDVLSSARGTLETELNSTGDNPMVLLERREMVGTGNFHPAGVSIAFDTVAIALAQVTSMAANRVVRLMDPHFTKLPPYLSVDPGSNVGLGVVQKTATALNSEVRLAANPASLDYIPVAGSIEDHATMAVECVGKAGRAVSAAFELFAVELLVAAQAIDLRGRPRLGVGTAAAFAKIREQVPMMEEDRLVARDITTIRDLLVGGELLRAVSDATQLPLLGRFAYEADPAPAGRDD
jgi:histidine ammonia-lyase